MFNTKAFLGAFVDRLFLLVMILIVARIVSSWIRIPSNRLTDPVMNFVYDVTEPILGRLRNVVPPIMVGGMGIDLTPMIALLMVMVLQNFVLMIIRFLPV
ncbi:MAG: YggT family protein [Candidatus Aquicultorales bacterium]